MTGFVLDCSVAVSWIISDEADANSTALLERLGDEEAFVPNLWRLELANVLIQAEKRGRISQADSMAAFGFLDALPIRTDDQTDARAFREIQSLARSRKLTTYGAAYLELALRLNLPLATKHKAVRKAAKKLDVPTLP